MFKFLSRFVELVSWLVGAMLVVRFIMRMLAASTSAPFVEWLYEVTNSLMVPFRGIFPTVPLAKTSYLDIPALVAAVIYLGVGYFLSNLLNSMGHSMDGAKSQDKYNQLNGGGNIPNASQRTISNPDMSQNH